MLRLYVRQGDTLLSLSKRYGVPPEKIRDHPNNTALRNTGCDIAILHPGDLVSIPDPEVKMINCETDERHRFRCNNRMCELHVQFLRMDQPRGGEPYLLRLDQYEISGLLDDEGWLSEMVPTDAQEGIVFLCDGDEQEEYPIRIGHLDPVDSVRGVQQRLKNLGFFFGEENDLPSDILSSAVRTFQAKYELEITGELNQATFNRLADIYGC